MRTPPVTNSGAGSKITISAKHGRKMEQDWIRICQCLEILGAVSCDHVLVCLLNYWQRDSQQFHNLFEY